MYNITSSGDDRASFDTCNVRDNAVVCGPECHTEIHNHDVECYCQYLCKSVHQLIFDYSPYDFMLEAHLAEFWQECIQLLPLDKDFDFHRFRKTW